MNYIEWALQRGAELWRAREEALKKRLSLVPEGTAQKKAAEAQLSEEEAAAQDAEMSGGAETVAEAADDPVETAAVRPKYCGQGIQKSLMRQGEELLKGTSFRYLMGTAHPDNTYSVNNFLKLEYEIIDEARKYGGLPRYVFCKEIR